MRQAICNLLHRADRFFLLSKTKIQTPSSSEMAVAATEFDSDAFLSMLQGGMGYTPMYFSVVLSLMNQTSHV